jgi:hypothetical protein
MTTIDGATAASSIRNRIVVFPSFIGPLLADTWPFRLLARCIFGKEPANSPSESVLYTLSLDLQCFLEGKMRKTLAMLVCFVVPTFVSAQSPEETAFARGLLTNLNRLSIQFNREVCGFIVRSPSGRIQSTKASWGTAASCMSNPVPPEMTVISSWHTHAAWGLGYDGEVPSTIDVEGDMRMGVDGWVSTPGGRLWFIDGQTGRLEQICGRDCLPADPNFYPEEHGPVAKNYTLSTLQSRFGQR